jgi:hypothetical protein
MDARQLIGTQTDKGLVRFACLIETYNGLMYHGP